MKKIIFILMLIILSCSAFAVSIEKYKSYYAIKGDINLRLPLTVDINKLKYDSYVDKSYIKSIIYPYELNKDVYSKIQELESRISQLEVKTK